MVIWAIVWFICYNVFFKDIYAIQYDGDYKVWFTQEMIDEQNFYVFYPTRDTKQQKAFANNKVFYGFYAQENAKLWTQKYPTIFLYHGYEGNWRNLSWLAAKLAAHGYIVVSQDVIGFSSNNYSLENFLTLQSTLDTSIKNIENFILRSNFSTLIDRDNISIGGASFGWLLALLIDGSSFEYTKMLQFCSTNPDSPSCEFLKEILPQISSLKNTIVSQKNTLNIDHIFVVTPWLWEWLTLKNEEKISVILAKNDTNILNETWEKLLPEEVRILDNTNHFSFLQICTENGKNILLKNGITHVCEEDIQNRSSHHEEIFLQIIKSLND